MNPLVLYVYSRTKFVLTADLEAFGGPPVSAGTRYVEPGIYRTDGTVEPAEATLTPGYEIASASATKGGYPDPPVVASEQFGRSPSEIKAWLAPSGAHNTI
jgi:hypothetical protein